MVGTRRTYRGGSIANFVIVGIILALGLVGGLYYLKNRGADVRKDVAIAEYEQQKTKDENSKTEADSKKTDEQATKPEAGVNERVNTSNELPTTGPSSLSNLVAIFFLSMAFSYYLSSIYQRSRF